MKTRTRIACWNVRTLSEDSRLAQAEAEMLRYNLQILGLSEVRRNGFGELRTFRGLTLLYSGKEDEEDTRECGVGFLLSDVAKRGLLDWKPISDRIITARFYTKARKISVVQCYAPTNSASEELKDDFYSALNTTLRNIRKQDIVIVMGDLNAKIGTGNAGYERHMGKQGLGVRNENGERFLEFCQNNDLTIGGTLFIHRDHHKYTWNSPDGDTKNQIDHLAISSKWRTSLLDVRNRRGADIDSDHHLVVAEVRLKVSASRASIDTARTSRRFDVSKLMNSDIKDTFKMELRNRFSVLDTNSTTVDEEWNRIKMVYTETSSVVLGHKTHTREEWMSQETWDLIGQRRELHLNLTASSDEIVQEDLRQQYRQMRKRIYRSTRRDRRVWADGIADGAQRAADSGNLKEMYKATKALSGRRGYPDRFEYNLKYNQLSNQSRILRCHPLYKESSPNLTNAVNNLTEIKEESESGSSTITQAAPKCSTSIPPVRVKRKLSQRAAFVKRLKVAQSDVSRTDEETDYDLFGKSVSSQLKKLSEEQAAIAQESIQSILTQCKLADIRARKPNSDFLFQTPQFTQSMQHVCTQYQSSYQPLKCSPPESSPSGDASFALGFQNTSSDVPDSYKNDNPDEST
ncbi:unnamed protein product [Euphydryas editha]|uniref:Endonuclease/exonuclease/phosphatase domain-containing protein n=1 Tax=Euphydryas editha TaxID=104508 RepID=A0AAU9UJC4_EUPED|nr:unnamed protein product [Euphydryas editha]